MSNCASCGRHRSYGCAFDCPERKPPELLTADMTLYRAWADEQKRHYANGEVPGEQRKETA